jgi:phage shock protein E
MGWFSRLLQSQAPAPLPAHAVLIDVRSPAEFASGAVEGSINLPLDRFAQDIERVVPERETPVLLFCAAGGRSAQACAYLQRLGYTQVSNGGGAGMVAARLQRPLRQT